MEYAPGVHSRNTLRATSEQCVSRVPLRRLRLTLLTIGLACLGYYLYALGDQFVYQAYENWAFDQLIAGHQSVNFLDFLRARSGMVPPEHSPPGSAVSETPAPTTPEVQPFTEGELVGRVVIERLGISAIVREGVSDSTLTKAVGHVPGTSLPGQPGNFAIAAHRDTLFRALKDIQTDDSVVFETATKKYNYAVRATSIVKPSDVTVLQANGGGLVPAGSNKPPRLLTMITCYPFRYVGSAPKRFIVEAELTEDKDVREKTNTGVAAVPARLLQRAAGRKPARPVAHRGFRRTSDSGAGLMPTPQVRDEQAKRRGFWYRLFH